MYFATAKNHPHLPNTLTTNILETQHGIMDKLICAHELCKRKAMKHGNGYCYLHGKKGKFEYPQCSNYVQSYGLCVQHGYKKKNAVTTDAPTMPSRMAFASIMVQSAIAQSLVVASCCFRHGSADLTSGVFRWQKLNMTQRGRAFWQQQKQWLVCVVMHQLRPQVVLSVDKKFIPLIMMPQS
jgi:hypothetical protein